MRTGSPGPATSAILFAIALAAVPHPAVADNLISNGTFDTDIAGWESINELVLSWSAMDANASPSSGSLRFDNSLADDNGSTPGVTRCVPVEPGGRLRVSGDFLIPEGQAHEGRVSVITTFFAQPGCAAMVGRGPELQLIPTPGRWTAVDLTPVDVPVGIHSLEVFYGVRKVGDGGTLFGHLDNAVAELQGPCTPDDTSLCLNASRFRVEAAWRTADGSGVGHAVALTPDTGYFWFFNADNVELVVKVLDACELPGFNSYWVFAAGLTDVEVQLTVTDAERDESNPYFNPLEQKFQPITDTSAFLTCP